MQKEFTTPFEEISLQEPLKTNAFKSFIFRKKMRWPFGDCMPKL